MRGLERVFRALVPASLILLLSLFALAAWHDRLGGAISAILQFRPADVGTDSVKAALFHAFFTLGLGMGVWAIFGAYTPAGVRLKRSVLAVVLMDTLVAILAGVLIFATATTDGSFDGERGFSLLFVSLPVALAPLPGSQFIIAAAFLLVVLVVWTTALALLEPVVGWFREWTGAPRGWSVFILGVLVWLAGLVTLLSFNLWSDVRLAGGTPVPLAGADYRRAADSPGGYPDRVVHRLVPDPLVVVYHYWQDTLVVRPYLVLGDAYSAAGGGGLHRHFLHPVLARQPV